MKRNFIYFTEAEMILDELEINRKRHEFFNVSQRQFLNWRNKNKIPLEKFQEFQKELATFLDKENLRKKVAMKLIDKAFLQELIAQIESTEFNI